MSLRVLSLLAVLAIPALAQTTIRPLVAIQPKGGAPAEMEKLKDLLGTWTCRGKGVAQASIKLEARDIKAKFVVSKDADGFWCSVRWDEEKTKANPHPLRAVGNQGWDPSAKNYLVTWFDNLGWGVRLSSSPGPFEGVWSWQGPLVFPDGRRAISRQTLAPKAKDLTVTWEIEVVGGEKMLMWEGMSCKKG